MIRFVSGSELRELLLAEPRVVFPEFGLFVRHHIPPFAGTGYLRSVASAIPAREPLAMCTLT
jgi:hypothetical protein